MVGVTGAWPCRSMKKIPFGITDVARDRILAQFEPGSDDDVALVVTLGGYTTLKEGRIVDEHSDVRFVVGRYPKGSRGPETFYDFFGRPLSVASSTLEHLQGATLTYEPRRDTDGHEHYVLCARKGA